MENDIHQSHWSKHKVLRNTIKELSPKEDKRDMRVGDNQDENLNSFHITPRQQDRIATLTGRNCLELTERSAD